jgi:hypothetical protein
MVSTPHPSGRTVFVKTRSIHCDEKVLHRPGTCYFCDEHGADLQAARENVGVNFTGENDPSKAPCPADRRGSNPHDWPRNRPAGTREEHRKWQDEYWAEVRKNLHDGGLSKESIEDIFRKYDIDTGSLR